MTSTTIEADNSRDDEENDEENDEERSKDGVISTNVGYDDDSEDRSSDLCRCVTQNSSSSSSSSSSRPRIYHIVGCTGRYTDFVSASIPSVQRMLVSPKSKRKGPRGGVNEPFPHKLYEMLVGMMMMQKGQQPPVAAWRDHGRCFEITDPNVFAEDVMPRYFKQSKLTSFQRQLNLYGFQRVSTGVDKGCYYHPLFLRGRPDLCRIMVRTRVKGNHGTVVRESDPKMECNSFYDLPTCPMMMVAATASCHATESARDHTTVSSEILYHRSTVVQDDEDDEQVPDHHSRAVPLILPQSSPDEEPPFGQSCHNTLSVGSMTLPTAIVQPSSMTQCADVISSSSSSNTCFVHGKEEKPMERTPHYYEYIPPAAVQVAMVGPSDCAGYYSNHVDTISSYNAVVSPMQESNHHSHHHNNHNWFPMFPSDEFPIPEDELSDPIWGRAFQCMDDDGIQAYERSMERRYRPCKP